MGTSKNIFAFHKLRKQHSDNVQNTDPKSVSYLFLIECKMEGDSQALKERDAMGN